MESIWTILGLEPTRDISAIRRAYAGKSRTCHPEEDPEGFLNLRKAYEAALDYAESGSLEVQLSAVQRNPPVKQEKSREDNKGGISTDSEGAFQRDIKEGSQRDAKEDSQKDAKEDSQRDAKEDFQRDAKEDFQRDAKEDFHWDFKEEEPQVSHATPEDDGWYLYDGEPEAASNPYAGGEAIQSFLELYTGKQRKDSKRWMDYFTSDAFLSAGWDSHFTALLLEKVTEVEQTLPPCKEFLMWLCTAYQFSVKENVEINKEQLRVERRERQVELCPGAEFDGMEYILRIAAKGPLPKRPGGDELALLESFKDYRHLVRLAENGAWNAQAMEEYLYTLNRYILFYIKERCDPKANPENQRHPAGLRLILHFLRREDLPETLYREAWRKLDLKSAVMGRTKILYGLLRELVIERVSDIVEKEPENFLKLNRDHDAYRARIKTDPEREDEESAAFFRREDMQKALRSSRFVAEQLLNNTNWRREGMGAGLVRRMLEFYQENPDIPWAGEVVKGLEEDLRSRMVEVWNREDSQAEVCPRDAHLTLCCRPLLRHWLNTVFFTAQDPETGMMLMEYLDKNLPYQADWSRRFAECEDGSQPPRTAAMCGGEVEVDFYPRHMEYRVHGKPVYRPCLSFEQVLEEGGEWFLFLLPLTAASCDWFPRVAQEIFLRTSGIDMPEEDRLLIARCLAGDVCCLPVDEYTREPIPPEEALPFTLFAETEEQLFGCSWMEGGSGLTLFEQTVFGRRVRKQWEVEPENAEAEARRLLAEAVSPTNYDFSLLKELPLEVYVLPLEGPEYVLKREGVREVEAEMDLHWPELDRGELVTEEALAGLLGQFARKALRRLELKWYEGKLVFVKDPAGYACFFFERGDDCDIWYSMISKPEVYRTVDSNDVVYVPFGMGKLEDYCIHKSPASILRNLERVFPEMGKDHIPSGGPSGWLWACRVNRSNGWHKLLMAQQKLGGFPPNRGRNHLTKKGFVFSRYPIELAKETLEGEKEQIEIRGGSNGRASEALLEFMAGKLAYLRLTWMFKVPESGRRHLVLLQDHGRFLMAWLQDDCERAYLCAVEGFGAGGSAAENSGAKSFGAGGSAAESSGAKSFGVGGSVAESSGAESFGTEGSEAEEEMFLGILVPVKLLHRDLKCIRNCVDLLLDDINYTDPVVKRYFLPADFSLRQYLSNVNV